MSWRPEREKGSSFLAPSPWASLMGRALVDFPIRVSLNLSAKSALTVVLQQGSGVEEYLGQNYSGKISFAYQKAPLGTADGVKSYFAGNSLAKTFKHTLVLCADTPLLEEDTLLSLLKTIRGEEAKAVVASFKTDNPTGYGRIVPREKGFSIVEEKEATEEEKKIDEVNAGIYIFETSYLLNHLTEIENDNRGREFYLTDIFRPSPICQRVCFADEKLFHGVNSLEELERAENILRRRKIRKLREMGVRFIDSRHVYVEDEVSIAGGVVVYPHAHLRGATKIGENCTIENGAVVANCQIGPETVIKAYSYIEGAKIGKNCSIGPFAHLRPKTDIGPRGKVGNFVEVKNATLKEGVSLAHLSYVGDGEIGEGSNIGCGFITCNYDGESKHYSKVGANNFIGSNCQMIAPVETGDSCFVASGTTINKNLPDKSFAISRGKQTTIKDGAKRFLKGKWKID